MDFLIDLLNNNSVKLLLIVIVFDTFFGVLRAIRERKINSTIGIDGMIRKTGMIFSILFLSLIDYVVNIDFIGFLPESIKTVLNINSAVGISFLFNILFILFEALSILKNMIKCKLPIPKKLQSWLEKVMKEFTNEIKE